MPDHDPNKELQLSLLTVEAISRVLVPQVQQAMRDPMHRMRSDFSGAIAKQSNELSERIEKLEQGLEKQTDHFDERIQEVEERMQKVEGTTRWAVTIYAACATVGATIVGPILMLVFAAIKKKLGL